MRRRRLPIIAISLVLALAPAAAVGEETGLADIVAGKAGIITLLHDKAAHALVTVAQDESFARYFRAETEAERLAAKRRIEEISLAMERRFRVGEMCLIGADGAEITRIVGSRVALDLDIDESDSIFFAPTFELRSRPVSISPIYASADSDTWVIAYSTPIRLDGETRAILHYEHSLQGYMQAIVRDHVESPRFILVFDAIGRVIYDSRRPMMLTAVTMNSEQIAAYVRPFELDGLTLADTESSLVPGVRLNVREGLTAQGRYRAASIVVEGWTVLALEPA